MAWYEIYTIIPNSNNKHINFKLLNTPRDGEEKKVLLGWLADGLCNDKDWFGGGCKSETVFLYINVLVSRKMFCAFSAFTILCYCQWCLLSPNVVMNFKCAYACEEVTLFLRLYWYIDIVLCIFLQCVMCVSL